MADRPTPPTVPTPPDRAEPSTFAARADAWVAAFPSYSDWLRAMADYVDQRAGDAMAAAIAGDINSLDLSQFAGRAIGVDAGGTMLTGIIFQALVKATQDQAEGGTDNDAYMTALRVKQLAEALFPSNNGWVKIAEKTANGSASLVFSGDDFQSSLYRHYQFIFGNILPSTDGANLRLVPSDDGGNSTTRIKRGSETGYQTTGYWELTGDIGMASNEPGLCGELNIYNFHEDTGAFAKLEDVYTDNNGRVQINYSDTGQIRLGASLQQPSVDAPLNYIRFQMDTGNIASGSIILMGLRG